MVRGQINTVFEKNFHSDQYMMDTHHENSTIIRAKNLVSGYLREYYGNRLALEPLAMIVLEYFGFFYMDPSKDPANFITQEEQEESLALKDEGNKLFSSRQYSKATEKYTQALSKDPSNGKVYSNRCQCYIELKNYKNAYFDAFFSIKHEPLWHKSWLRMAQVFYHLNQFNEALDMIKQAEYVVKTMAEYEENDEEHEKLVLKKSGLLSLKNKITKKKQLFIQKGIYNPNKISQKYYQSHSLTFEEKPALFQFFATTNDTDLLNHPPNKIFVILQCITDDVMQFLYGKSGSGNGTDDRGDDVKSGYEFANNNDKKRVSQKSENCKKLKIFDDSKNSKKSAGGECLASGEEAYQFRRIMDDNFKHNTWVTKIMLYLNLNHYKSMIDFDNVNILYDPDSFNKWYPKRDVEMWTITYTVLNVLYLNKRRFQITIMCENNGQVLFMDYTYGQPTAQFLVNCVLGAVESPFDMLQHMAKDFQAKTDFAALSGNVNQTNDDDNDDDNDDGVGLEQRRPGILRVQNRMSYCYDEMSDILKEFYDIDCVKVPMGVEIKSCHEMETNVWGYNYLDRRPSYHYQLCDLHGCYLTDEEINQIE